MYNNLLLKFVTIYLQYQIQVCSMKIVIKRCNLHVEREKNRREFSLFFTKYVTWAILNVKVLAITEVSSNPTHIKREITLLNT